MAQHCEESVHELEAIQANGLYIFGFVSQVSKDFEDRLSDLSGRVNEKSCEVFNLIVDDLLAQILLLLDQCP